MQMQIIEQLKRMNKITTEDISEALKEIPSAFEVELIKNIWDAYCDDVSPLPHEEVLNVWLSHFLPILREESFKCIEKVRELYSNPPS